jgi:hypothetical protein
MVLAAGLAMSDRQVAVSSEVEERLDLSGEWEGTWTTSKADSFAVRLSGRWLAVSDVPGGLTVVRAPILLKDGGGGRFAVCLAHVNHHGIYTWEKGGLLMCFREGRQGRPTSFHGGDGQHLMRLRRVN